MDVIIDRSAVKKMVEVAEQDKKFGVVQARVMLHPDTEKVNSLGNYTHFLGFGACVGYKDEYHKIEKPKPINYPSGAAVLFSRDILEKIGLFDEEFWMYNEDQDIGWRAWLSGYKCVLAPDAVVYHKYEFGRSVQKYYWMDRNRILVMLKNYRFLTLVLIFPAFLVMELGLILFSLKSGWFKEKIKVWIYFLNPVKWIYIRQKRQEVKRLRVVGDKEVAKMFLGRIWYQEIDDIKLRMINPVFNSYWKFVKCLIFW